MSLETWTCVIFAVTYGFIALGRIPYLAMDRTGIAIVGAILLMAIGALPVEEAPRHIDFSTLLLLYSFMMLSAQLRISGFYYLVANKVLQWSSKPWRLLTGLVLVSAVLSSLFANDIVCLAFTPVLCEALIRGGRDPLPYLLALATSSNIGSVATLIGNPQNMFIGQVGQLSFGHYALLLVPVAAAGAALNILVIAMICRRSLFSREKSQKDGQLPAGSEAVPAAPFEIARTLAITLLLLVAFLLGWKRETWALLAAGLLFFSRRHSPRKLHSLVDWNLMALFLGLFVIMGSLRERHLVEPVLHGLEARGLNLEEPWTLSCVSVVLSNLVSNVPAVLLLQNAAPHGHWQWWYLLALSSTLAGNLTLLGSIANLIVAEQASLFGVKMGFWPYLKVGLPLTLLTVLLGTAWLSLFWG
jgi:Na+/H+ antiporter NhaD/arsenite permease-like protein